MISGYLRSGRLLGYFIIWLMVNILVGLIVNGFDRMDILSESWSQAIMTIWNISVLLWMIILSVWFVSMMLG